MRKTLNHSWIVEGVHYAQWAEETYKNADILIILSKPRTLLAKRIVKRCLREEKDHYKNKYLDACRLMWMMIREGEKNQRQYYAIAKEHGKRLIVVADECNERVLNEVKEAMRT